MELTYKNIKEISQERLVDLFKSVEWESANYPAQLVQAIKNYGSVFSAWDNDKCVGLVASDVYKRQMFGLVETVLFYQELRLAIIALLEQAVW